jgi:hypothetical protein
MGTHDPKTLLGVTYLSRQRPEYKTHAGQAWHTGILQWNPVESSTLSISHTDGFEHE